MSAVRVGGGSPGSGSAWGCLGVGGSGVRGWGREVPHNNDDKCMTPYNRPDFVALGLKNKLTTKGKGRKQAHSVSVKAAQRWQGMPIQHTLQTVTKVVRAA